MQEPSINDEIITIQSEGVPINQEVELLDHEISLPEIVEIIEELEPVLESTESHDSREDAESSDAKDSSPIVITDGVSQEFKG